MPENPASYRVVRTKSYLFNKAVHDYSLLTGCIVTVPHSGDLLPLTNHNCVRPAFHAGFFSHNSVQTESEWSSPCPARLR
ncbi:TPA: hypothetical protein MIT43_26860 [Klebsiella pneumoniae]|nr:hypothetical protein [Klebsiella pneumoniae]